MAGLPSIDQMQANSYNQDRSLQDFYNQNATNATNQYNTARDTANNAQNQLQDFTKNMVNGSDVYQKQLALGNQNAGYDVNNLNQAQNQVSQLTGILGGLPRAIQANNANYGATAGNVANQYATTGANLNQSLQLANQNAANQLAKQQGGLAGAQQGTTATLQAQDQQRQGYEAAANNAAQIMSTAQTQMAAMIQAQQNGQQLTAKDQEAFGNLRQAYAAAAQAKAQADLLISQTTASNLANKQTQDLIDKGYYTVGGQPFKPATANTVSQSNQASNGGDFWGGVNGFLNDSNKNIHNWESSLGLNKGFWGSNV